MNFRKAEEKSISRRASRSRPFENSFPRWKTKRGEEKKSGGSVDERKFKVYISFTVPACILSHTYFYSSRVCPLSRQPPSPPREIPPRHLFVRALKTACRTITTPFLLFLPLRTALSRGLPDTARLSLSLSSYFFFFFYGREITPEEGPSVRTTDFLAGFYFRYDQGGDVDAYDIDAGGDDVP